MEEHNKNCPRYRIDKNVESLNIPSCTCLEKEEKHEHEYEIIISGQKASIPQCLRCSKMGSRINFIYKSGEQKLEEWEIELTNFIEKQNWLDLSDVEKDIKVFISNLLEKREKIK